jgi:two-component system response regulator GlrR
MQDGDRLARLNLIGQSPVFLAAVRLIHRIARSDATALIQGETGTGKELAARAIHYLGDRRDHPFVAVNCGAIPDHLIENELFGHSRGAYTDARDATGGVIASAGNGTLFLDEVENLSPKAQVTLLRFLQDGSFRPLGGGQAISVNVRVVAATNIELSDLVRSGSFRADLMYRLRLLTVTMPPLRQRPSDIAVLARHFLQQFAARYDRTDCLLDPPAIAALERYAWPGNVRELENVIHREFLLSDDDTLWIRDFTFEPAERTAAGAIIDTCGDNAELGFGAAKARAIEAFERGYLLRALSRSGGNVSAAARNSGKERRAFGKLLKKHGIEHRQSSERCTEESHL